MRSSMKNDAKAFVNIKSINISLKFKNTNHESFVIYFTNDNSKACFNNILIRTGKVGTSVISDIWPLGSALDREVRGLSTTDKYASRFYEQFTSFY